MSRHIPHLMSSQSYTVIEQICAEKRQLSEVGTEDNLQENDQLSKRFCSTNVTATKGLSRFRPLLALSVVQQEKNRALTLKPIPCYRTGALPPLNISITNEKQFCTKVCKNVILFSSNDVIGLELPFVTNC